VRARRAQVPIVSLQVPVDTSCEYAGLPYIDHFGETIAFVGGINKPKLVQCFDRRACAPVDLAGQHQAVLRPRCHAFTWHQAPVRHKSISGLDTKKSNGTSTNILWLGSAKAVSLLALQEETHCLVSLLRQRGRDWRACGPACQSVSTPIHHTRDAAVHAKGNCFIVTVQIRGLALQPGRKCQGCMH